MKTNKTKTNNKTRSMKGKKGTVGAPAKVVRWPAAPFTVKTLQTRNEHQCTLSLRTKIDAAVAAGAVIQLAPKKQANGGVGRPEARFVTAEKFDGERMVKFGEKVVTKATVKRKTRSVKTVVAVSPTPAEPVAEVSAQPAPQPVMESVAMPEVPAEQPAVEVPPVA